MQYDLDPLTTHVWRAKCAQGRDGFLLTGDRMQRIRFERKLTSRNGE
jgi:hypothetical protein